MRARAHPACGVIVKSRSFIPSRASSWATPGGAPQPGCVDTGMPSDSGPQTVTFLLPEPCGGVGARGQRLRSGLSLAKAGAKRVKRSHALGRRRLGESRRGQVLYRVWQCSQELRPKRWRGKSAPGQVLRGMRLPCGGCKDGLSPPEQQAQNSESSRQGNSAFAQAQDKQVPTCCQTVSSSEIKGIDSSAEQTGTGREKK